MNQASATTASAITVSQEMSPMGVLKLLAIPAKDRSELNTVVSLPNSRARPRTAVSEPSVTMKGGSFRAAISVPLMRPKPAPTRRPTGIVTML